jgi:hypothetical protein
MAQFTQTTSAAQSAGSTTVLNNFMWTCLTAGQIGKMKMFSWGGLGTTSTGYRTRWARNTNASIATPTSLGAVGAANPLPVALCIANTYGTAGSAAADPAGNLFAINWNILGGGGVIVLPIGGEWLITGAALGTATGINAIGCGNVTGSANNESQFSLTWEE